MRKILYSLVLMLAVIVPAIGADGLSPEEQSLIDKCYANIRQKILSVDTAQVCIERLNDNDAALLKKLQESDADLASGVVAYNSALVDLKATAMAYSNWGCGQAINRLLDDYPCPLCDMNLGPEPEKLFPWAEKNLPAKRVGALKTGVRTWSVVNQGLMVQPLAQMGANEAEWNAMDIEKRYRVLSLWARQATDKMVDHFTKNPPATDQEKKEVESLAKFLMRNLPFPDDTPYIDKLFKLMEFITTAQPVKPPESSAPGNAPGIDAGVKKVGELRQQSTMDQNDFLKRAFDKAGLYNVAEPPPTAVGTSAEFKPIGISKEQAETLAPKLLSINNGKLQGHIADEMRGTKSGDEIITFYEDRNRGDLNKLDFGFVATQPGFMARWNRVDRDLRVSTAMVNYYMEQRKITPDELLASEQHQKGLARFIAPVFVHEGTHQRQFAWEGQNDLGFLSYKGQKLTPLQIEMEVEAFTMGSAFAAEKCRQVGPAYLGQIPYPDRRDAEKYLEDGVNAIRLEKHLYPNYAKQMDTRGGASSKEMRAAIAINADLMDLEEKNRKNPSAMTEQDKADLAFCKDQMKSRYKWYAMVYRKSHDDEAKLNAWRAEIDADGSTLNTLKTYIPEKPL